MTDRNYHHHEGYSSGFIMGVLVGAAAVFFLGTKKGRHLAKELKSLAGETETKGKKFVQEAKLVTQKLNKQAKSGKKTVTKEARKKLTHIKKLQAKGRAAAARYFKK